MDSLIAATPAVVEAITTSAANAAAAMVASAQQNDGTGIVMAGFVVMFFTMIGFSWWAIKRTSGEAERTRQIYQEQQELISKVIISNTDAIERLEMTMSRSGEPHLRAVEKLGDNLSQKMERLEQKMAALRCHEQAARTS